jgi:hypothetical protein
MSRSSEAATQRAMKERLADLARSYREREDALVKAQGFRRIQRDQTERLTSERPLFMNLSNKESV